MPHQLFLFFYGLSHHYQFFDDLVIFFAYYFPFIVGFAAFIFLFIHKNWWREIAVVFFSAFLATGLSHILKNLFKLTRPLERLLSSQNIQTLFPETGFAFPSGHASFFSALAIAIYLGHKKAGAMFIVFALIIGLARVIAGVHFPLDILAGYLLGCLVAMLVNNVYCRFAKMPQTI